jgi:branched-subunit amino acid aminotransferase/4-amino-4-deoxychorismate lyase
LLEGLASLKIQMTQINLRNLTDHAKKLTAQSKIKTGFLRIAISRGIGSKGYMPTQNINPTIVMEIMSNANMEQGSAELFLSSYEKISPRALPVMYKLMQGLSSILAKIEAEEQGCFEALLLDNKGYICEVSSGNIFWFDGQSLYTPSIECGIVAGIIRKRIIELSPYKVQEGEYTIDHLKTAESVFITNVNWLALPAVSLLPSKIHFPETQIASKIREILLKDQRQYVQGTSNWQIS